LVTVSPHWFARIGSLKIGRCIGAFSPPSYAQSRSPSRDKIRPFGASPRFFYRSKHPPLTQNAGVIYVPLQEGFSLESPGGNAVINCFLRIQRAISFASPLSHVLNLIFVMPAHCALLPNVQNSQ
jgi:hypothetical protein